MRVGWVLSLFLFVCSTVVAQDVVKLRNGKHVTGTVDIDPTDQNGFTVIRWDTGGKVYVLWTQVTPYERHRLENKPLDQDTLGEEMDGVHIVTTSREMIGLLLSGGGTVLVPPGGKEQLEMTVRVKTKDGATAVAIPRSSIEFYKPVKIREADAYSPTEMIERREKIVDPKDAVKLIELAKLARALKMPDRAKAFYEQAMAADPARKDEIGAIVAQLDVEIKEAAAEAKLAEILKLAEAGKFDEAIPLADKFVADYADTRIGQKNADLIARLKKDQEDYSKNRADYLAKKVPEAWRAQRSSLLSEYAKSKYKIVEARELTGRIDEEILDRLTKKFNCPPEDIAKAWEKRDQKKRTVDMADGTWIYKGGQDGGMDYESGGGGSGGEDPVDDFARRFGGGNKKKGNEKQAEEGKPLDTSDKWWAAASQSKRQEWLETEYALTSQYVKKDKEEEKKCSRCQGKGTLKATRNNKAVDVICNVCHKVAVTISVTYW